MRAYRAGDLKTLRTICDALEPPAEAKKDALEELREEAKRLRGSIRELDRELEEVKAAYPYSARVYLEDEQMGRAKEAELTGKLKELRERTVRYEAAITQMLAGAGEEAL